MLLCFLSLSIYLFRTSFDEVAKRHHKVVFESFLLSSTLLAGGGQISRVRLSWKIWLSIFPSIWKRRTIIPPFIVWFIWNDAWRWLIFSLASQERCSKGKPSCFTFKAILGRWSFAACMYGVTSCSVYMPRWNPGIWGTPTDFLTIRSTSFEKQLDFGTKKKLSWFFEKKNIIKNKEWKSTLRSQLGQFFHYQIRRPSSLLARKRSKLLWWNLLLFSQGSDKDRFLAIFWSFLPQWECWCLSVLFLRTPQTQWIYSAPCNHRWILW